MQVTKERAAPATTRLSDHQHRVESTMHEAAPASCAGCDSTEALYIIGAGFLCLGCIASTVSIACDIWPTDVSYTQEFERVLIYG